MRASVAAAAGAAAAGGVVCASLFPCLFPAHTTPLAKPREQDNIATPPTSPERDGTTDRAETKSVTNAAVASAVDTPAERLIAAAVGTPLESPNDDLEVAVHGGDEVALEPDEPLDDVDEPQRQAPVATEEEAQEEREEAAAEKMEETATVDDRKVAEHRGDEVALEPGESVEGVDELAPAATRATEEEDELQEGCERDVVEKVDETATVVEQVDDEQIPSESAAVVAETATPTGELRSTDVERPASPEMAALGELAADRSPTVALGRVAAARLMFEEGPPPPARSSAAREFVMDEKMRRTTSLAIAFTQLRDDLTVTADGDEDNVEDDEDAAADGDADDAESIDVDDDDVDVDTDPDTEVDSEAEAEDYDSDDGQLLEQDDNSTSAEVVGADDTLCNAPSSPRRCFSASSCGSDADYTECLDDGRPHGTPVVLPWCPVEEAPPPSRSSSSSSGGIAGGGDGDAPQLVHRPSAFKPFGEPHQLLSSPAEMLLMAAARGDATEVRRLLIAGAGVDAVGAVASLAGGAAAAGGGGGATATGTTKTALWRAAGAKEERTDVIEALLEGGAEVNRLGGQDGSTALHRAAARGHASVCEALLLAGADWRQEDKEGRAPLQIAQENGKQSVVEMLNAWIDGKATTGD